MAGVGGVVAGDAADRVVADWGQVAAGRGGRGDPGEYRVRAALGCDVDPDRAEQRPRHGQPAGRPVQVRRAADDGVTGAAVTPGTQVDVAVVPLGCAGPQGRAACAQEPERAQDQQHADHRGDDPRRTPPGPPAGVCYGTVRAEDSHCHSSIR